MPPEHSYCGRFAMTMQARAARLALLGLDAADIAHAHVVQTRVIVPHVDEILDAFYQRLRAHPHAREIIEKGSSFETLKATQRAYLLSLGVNFTSEGYFEERLRIGAAHLRVGLEPSLYQCAYSVLQQLLLAHIPSHDRDAAQLTAFVLKITNLDMSLAIEAYQESMIESLRRSLDSLKDEASTLSERIATDALTGVLSRAKILELLTSRLTEVNTHHPAAVIMADLDHFKNVNDQYGHTAGDQVLAEVAQRMRYAVRRVNAIGRYGGEEFLIVLNDASPEQAAIIAERIRERVAAQQIKINGQDIAITVSLGIGCSNGELSAMDLINRSDEALYAAKRKGRNRVEVANP